MLFWSRYKAPPDERGGNRYVRPKATAPHLDSTIHVAVIHRRAVIHVRSASDSDRFLCEARNDAKCQKETFAILPDRLRMDLLRLDAGRLDDRPPLLDLGLMQSAECFGCLLVAWRDFAANSSKP